MAIPTIGQPSEQIPGQLDVDQALQMAMQERLMGEQRRVACLDYAVKSFGDDAGQPGTANIINRAAAFENYIINGRLAPEDDMQEGGDYPDEEPDG